MYGYRNSSQSGLMTNLNSISSSLSSIDTIGTNRRNNTLAKSSVDNLLSSRNANNNHMTAASTSAAGGWWRNNRAKEDRYSNAATIRNLERGNFQSSDVYHYGKRQALKSYCLSSNTALNFVLVLLLLLTILRQTFDFLGQLWLQILINFFTILIIIVALFGLKQNRISYLVLFAVWAIFNTTWNLLVISIHFKVRDINLSEDLLSLNTGAISWWNTNGPGCLPYSITASIHQSVSILKPNIITGCRFDYHLLESVQAAIHSSLSIIGSLICCYVALSICRNPNQFSHNNNSSKTHKPSNLKDPKSYRLNELTSNGRSIINHDPFPVNSTTSRFVAESTSNSLRRAPNKMSVRSSQHSMSSARSERRRQRQQMADMVAGTSCPTPRGSTSSVQRSQKYGSLSSRRSNSNRRDRRGEVSSLTYSTTTAATTTANRANGTSSGGPRTRLSSLSSADYLPSYQPPHSSSANLLSSYGEISSIDSYNNPSSSNRGLHSRNQQHRMKDRGNANPVYNGSRSSVCSQNINTNTNINNNNYDDISNVYGINGTTGGVYGAASSMTDRTR